MAQVRLLAELVEAPAWAAFEALVEYTAEIHARRLLTTLPLDQTNIERGAIAALNEVAALPSLIVNHQKELDRVKRTDDNDNAGLTWNWGNPLFTDHFNARGPGR